MVSNIAKHNDKSRIKKLSSFFTSMSPSQVLVLGFIVIVLLGGLILSLPISNVGGHSMKYLDALFTATSATCVTGLVVVDTATNFTRFGQIVILILIQVGGLGFMAMATMIFLILGRRIGLRSRLLLQESFNKFSLSGLVRLTKMVMGLTFFIEGLGALFLFLRLKNFMPMGEAVFAGVFHSISAFCNAGFDVFGRLNGEFSSLAAYTTDGYIPIVIGLLIIVGGLGFPVLAEVISYGSNRSTHVSLHTRLVIKITAALLIFGTIAILILEYTNPETLRDLPFIHKFINSFFTSITPRTAGYNTIPTGGLRESTALIIMMLMFIGASPSSTGGGIKTVTAGVLMMSLVSTIKGDDVVEYHERRIPRDQVLRATAVVLLAAFVVLIGTLIVSLVESASFLDIMFEVISAFATVGLSRGITPNLGPISRFIIIVIMLMGRLGPLTFAVALNYKKSMSKVKVTFPEEHVMIG